MARVLTPQSAQNVCWCGFFFVATSPLPTLPQCHKMDAHVRPFCVAALHLKTVLLCNGGTNRVAVLLPMQQHFSVFVCSATVPLHSAMTYFLSHGGKTPKGGTVDK